MTSATVNGFGSVLSKTINWDPTVEAVTSAFPALSVPLRVTFAVPSIPSGGVKVYVQI